MRNLKSHQRYRQRVKSSLTRGKTTNFGIMSFEGNLKQPISIVISNEFVCRYCQSCIPPARWYLISGASFWTLRSANATVTYQSAPFVMPFKNTSPSADKPHRRPVFHIRGCARAYRYASSTNNLSSGLCENRNL